MRHAVGAVLGLGLGAAGCGLSLPVLAQNGVPKDIIAVQVRKQGFPCKNPESATRSGDEASGDATWILKCEDASYKVVLVPKQAAKIERLPDDTKPENPEAKPDTAPAQPSLSPVR